MSFITSPSPLNKGISNTPLILLLFLIIGFPLFNDNFVKSFFKFSPEFDFYSYQKVNYTRPKQYLTIGATLFQISTPGIYHDTLNAIGSWLSSSPSVIVHLYDIQGGMGNLSQPLIQELQKRFGKDRIFVKGFIQKRLAIEDLALIIETIEADCETPLCALINTDIIISPETIDYLYIVDDYFGDIKNWSVHFPRANLDPSCRPKVNIDIVNSDNWSTTISTIAKECMIRIQPFGWDIFLWNHLGISLGHANIPRYLYGRPHFEYGIAKRTMEQGYYLTTYPFFYSYHLDHPERGQVQFNPKHPHAQYNFNLNRINHIQSFPNSNIPVRMNKTYIFTKHEQKLSRPKWATSSIKYHFNKPFSYPGFSSD